MKHLGVQITDKKELEKLVRKKLKDDDNFIAGMISFNLMYDGTINISCECQEEMEGLAEIYALMIDRINSGHYTNEIELAIDMQSNKVFVNKCLNFLKSMREHPVVEAREVFGHE